VTQRKHHSITKASNKKYSHNICFDDNNNGVSKQAIPMHVVHLPIPVLSEEIQKQTSLFLDRLPVLLIQAL